VAESFLAVAETAAAVETAAEVGTVAAVVETAVEFVVSELVGLIACVGCSLGSQHEISADSELMLGRQMFVETAAAADFVD